MPVSGSNHHLNYSSSVRNYSSSNQLGNRTLLDLPSLLDSEDRIQRTPEEALQSRSIDIFTHTDSQHPSSKFHIEASSFKRTSEIKLVAFELTLAIDS